MFDAARFVREVVVPLRHSHGPFADDVARIYAVPPGLDRAELRAHLTWMRAFWERAATSGTTGASDFRRLLDLDESNQGSAGDAMLDPAWWVNESVRWQSDAKLAIGRITDQLRRAFGARSPSGVQVADLRRGYAHLPYNIVDAAFAEAGIVHPPPWSDRNLRELINLAIQAAGGADATEAEDVPSVPQPRRARRAGRLPDRAASSAILIGVTDYQQGYPALPSVQGNVEDLAALLSDEVRGGFDAGRVHRFVNPSTAVVAQVAELAEVVTDTLVVYYAGHGIVASDGTLHLALPDTIPGREMYTAVPYAHIRQMLRESPASNRIVILDCCFAGRALDFMSGGLVEGQIQVSGTYVLTATSDTQPAHATPGARNSAFTGALLDLFRGGIPDGGSLMLLDDVYPNLRLSLQRQGFPVPRVAGADNIGNLALIRNPAWSAAI